MGKEPFLVIGLVVELTLNLSLSLVVHPDFLVDIVHDSSIAIQVNLRKVRVSLSHLVVSNLQLDLVLDDLILELLSPRVSIKVIVVTDLVGHGVHDYIDSNDLIELVDSQPPKTLYSLEVDVAGQGGPSSERYGSKHLYAELPEAVLTGSDKPIPVSEDADIQ